MIFTVLKRKQLFLIYGLNAICIILFIYLSKIHIISLGNFYEAIIMLFFILIFPFTIIYLHIKVFLNYIEFKTNENSLIITKYTKEGIKINTNIYPFEEIQSYLILDSKCVAENRLVFKFKPVNKNSKVYYIRSNKETLQAIENSLIEIHKKFTAYNSLNNEHKINLSFSFIASRYGYYFYKFYCIAFPLGLLFILYTGKTRVIFSIIPYIVIYLSVLARRTSEITLHDNLLKNNTF